MVNVLATQDERKAMEQGKYCVTNYKDEGISQIAVFRSDSNGKAETMFEYIPDNIRKEK